MPGTPTTQPLRHSHRFDQGNPLAERNTRWAVLLTACMMVAEIAGGWLFNSMALLADGWHMSSHALALGLAVLAYGAARRYANDPRFSFGTWKIEVLGSYTSALLLLLVAGLMLYQSVERLLDPSPIHYQQAMLVAALGLLVNLAFAWLLRDGHAHHGHGHSHHHHHHHHHHDHHAHRHDLNLRAAYLHVLADAATSLLAIVALAGGLLWNAAWLDPLMGIVGAVLVSVWACGLIRQSSRVLLDAQMDAPVAAEIRAAIASSPLPAELLDLHLWQVGQGKYACLLSLLTTEEGSADYFKRRLAEHEELVHITVEVNPLLPLAA
ncbi:CDF family iron/cobalt efflux transporter AitP [Pseudomonas aeruginosa]|uniref:CDF family iron/cobalt efflux transporter AitP n=1 Tax=Pseudomonas aeruginosa TaxID=287 RepID=UPI00087792D4|nr:CDF family iron/cobalt efflux transporter AitP [Pseudomonas aeruginosa]